VLAVAGAHDLPTPVPALRHIALGVQRGRLLVLGDVAHLPPAEDPAAVAELVTEHCRTDVPPDLTVGQIHASGMRVRREVLGDSYVDAATARAGELTAEFQSFITRYAWGEVWGRAGLDRRSRSIVTLTALVARGQYEELALHLRGALRNGLTPAEIAEVLLHCAIYCGVPAANSAFRVAAAVLEES
jgi:3-oxoadipate enol-lactonase/4-carboxymuconolactone decarboxylase